MNKKKDEPKKLLWRNSRQLRGVRSQLTVAINTSYNGAYAEVDLKTARNLLEICDQAIHTEEGHEPSKYEIAQMERSR